MKIKRGDIYQIKLYLEPKKISDHNRRDNGTLSFTGVELIDAIVSVGMPGHEIGAVNTGHRQGDDGPDAEMARGQRRVFAAGALTIVFASH